MADKTGKTIAVACGKNAELCGQMWKETLDDGSSRQPPLRGRNRQGRLTVAPSRLQDPDSPEAAGDDRTGLSFEDIPELFQLFFDL